MKKLLLVAVLSIVGAITGCDDAKFPNLVSIQVSPGTPSIAAGLTQQFTAQGTFSNGATRDLTTLVTWSSSTTYVASIATGGLASTYSQGSTTITASFTQPAGTVTGSTTLTVGGSALVSIVVTDNSTLIPGPNSVGSAKTAAGTSHQFTAFGIYSDGGERNITSSVTWSSSPLTVATINNTGRAMGLTPGTATITATDPTTSLAQNASLVVTNATVTAIVVSPVNQTIAPLTRLSFSALGEFSDGTTQDVTADSSWNSTTGAATVTGGTATGIAAGPTVIQAVLGGVTGSASLTVSSSSLVSIALSPSAAGVAIGSTLPLQAVGTFTDGTKQLVNSEVAWSVTPNDGSIATVNPAGVVTGVAAGMATVKAQFGAVSQTATVTIQTLKSMMVSRIAAPDAQNADTITITPGSATIAPGTNIPFRAVATLADGTTQDVTSSVLWISSTPATAIVSDAPQAPGWASGIAAGTDTIAAVFSGQYAPVQLTVSSATLTSIAITPTAPQSIALGGAQKYNAIATFSDSTTQNLTSLVTWTSSDPAVAVIKFGQATSTGAGSTMVKAAANIDGNTASDDKALIVSASPGTP